MKFSEDYGNARYPISGYGDDYIQVNQTRHTGSLIITQQDLKTNWAANTPRDLSEISILQPLLEFNPEIVLLGTGRKTCQPSPEVMGLFGSHQIGLEVQDSASACRTFNILISEGRNVVAGLLLPGIEDTE